ncbi:methyltransferase domain-containing protein [Candidatus Daviesbacteria bacterium]|nr:methyltransferase domain-containing protein [Candidatus Daviesbacteria bacterium]
MKYSYVRSLACPSCLQSLSKGVHKISCPQTHAKFQKKSGIWDFLSFRRASPSQIENESQHAKGPWGRISDGSYEILAAFARGNKTLDIACGEGWIEALAPETVGLDFSLSALKKAKKNGAKNLVWGNAEHLPFLDNTFDLTINSGSLENIENPKKAIMEMARVSKMQIMVVHREFNLPFFRSVRNLFSFILKIKHQPVEKPLLFRELTKMLVQANLKVVYKGHWTLPLNYGRAINFLPEFSKVNSCFFVITIRQ